MSNVKIITQIHPFDESIEVEMVEITNEDGSFISMTKAHYDAQQAVVPPTINLGE
jgi:hypothetical protein